MSTTIRCREYFTLKRCLGEKGEYIPLLACFILLLHFSRVFFACDPYMPVSVAALPHRSVNVPSLLIPAAAAASTSNGSNSNCDFLHGRDVAIFLHVFPANAWRPILDDTVAALQQSPLRACGARYFHGLPAHMWPYGTADSTFSSYAATDSTAPPRSELDTLHALYGYCKTHPRSLVSYIHGKGSRLPPEASVTRFLRQWDWRRFHLYFLVEAPAGCLRALSSGKYDACGVNALVLPEFSEPHFNGNFWWASCEYINNELPDPLLEPPPKGYELYFWPEFWLGSSMRARFFSCFKSGVDHYKSEYGRANYVGALCDVNVLEKGK